MKTYKLEGVVTALSSITHNGGSIQGNMARLRREKFIQPNGKVAEVPIISGNATRGILRDAGMYHMLSKLGYGIADDGSVNGIPLKAFYFLFSGGSLTSGGGDKLSIDTYRKLKTTIPLIALFGGAAGNSIMPGKMDVGKLYPIAKETSHLIPQRFHVENPQSVWDLCQVETYTRRDDAKNDRLLPMLKKKEIAAPVGLFPEEPKEAPADKEAKQQMIYNVETIAAGTQFFWQITLRDVTDLEFEAFITTLIYFSQTPTLGGKAGTGLGQVKINFDKWIEIDSQAHLKGNEIDMPLLTKYESHLTDRADDIRMVIKELGND